VEQCHILLLVLLLLGELQLELGLLLLQEEHLLLFGLLDAVGINFARRSDCLQTVESLHNFDLSRRAVCAEFGRLTLSYLSNFVGALLG
jgi:hypothetical protein